MTSSPAPQPCPFTAALHHGPVFKPKVLPAFSIEPHDGFFVSCPACEARGPVQPTEQMAVEAWNRSHAPAAATEALPSCEMCASQFKPTLCDRCSSSVVRVHPPGAGLAEGVDRMAADIRMFVSQFGMGWRTPSVAEFKAVMRASLSRPASGEGGKT